MHADDPLARLHAAGLAPDDYGVLERLLCHNRDQGGTLALFTGMQGCGKSTLLLAFVWYLVVAGETVIWRGRDKDEWIAFPPAPDGRPNVKVWSDYDPLFFQLYFPEDGQEERVPYDVPVARFCGPEDLVERTEPGVLNVVYAQEEEQAWVVLNKKTEEGEWRTVPTRFWGKLVKALAHKPSTRWHVLVLDELHEVWGDRPNNNSPDGEGVGDYDHQRDVRDSLADFRKAYNTLLAATHDEDETDEAILKKIQFRIYLRGARIPGSSVLRNKTPQLAPGEALLVNGPSFARLRYGKIQKPRWRLHVMAPLDWPRRHAEVKAAEPEQHPAPAARASGRPRARARRAKKEGPQGDFAVTPEPQHPPDERGWGQRDDAQT